MKTQKFHHLTFHFLNFDYSFGRSVLQDILLEKFPVTKKYFRRVDEKKMAEYFKQQFPGISEITLFVCDSMPSHKEGIVNIDRYFIQKIK